MPLTDALPAQKRPGKPHWAPGGETVLLNDGGCK